MKKDFHVLVLVGKSASGKDTIQKELVDYWNYSPIISTTSRPMRVGEAEGVNYYYVSKEEFEKKIEDNEMLEYRSYDTLMNGVPDVWYYGTSKQDLTGEHVVVLDPKGAKAFVDHYGKDNCTVAYIYAPLKVREERATRRGSFDEIEWNRRAKADDLDFKKVEEIADFTVANIGSLPSTVLSVLIHSGHVKGIPFNAVKSNDALDFFNKGISDVYPGVDHKWISQKAEEKYFDEHPDDLFNDIYVDKNGVFSNTLVPVGTYIRLATSFGYGYNTPLFLKFDLNNNKTSFVVLNAELKKVDIDPYEILPDVCDISDLRHEYIRNNPRSEYGDFYDYAMDYAREVIEDDKERFLIKNENAFVVIDKITSKEFELDADEQKWILESVKRNSSYEEFKEFNEVFGILDDHSMINSLKREIIRLLDNKNTHLSRMVARFGPEMTAEKIINKLNKEEEEFMKNNIQVSQVGDSYVVRGTFKGTMGELCEEITRMKDNGDIKQVSSLDELEGPTNEELDMIEIEGGTLDDGTLDDIPFGDKDPDRE